MYKNNRYIGIYINIIEILGAGSVVKGPYYCVGQKIKCMGSKSSGEYIFFLDPATIPNTHIATTTWYE